MQVDAERKGRSYALKVRRRERVMAEEVKFGLSESETELVDQLCAEYDPEQFIPQWRRERGSEADWQAYLRVERHEFRDEVEVAALVGSMINRPLDGQRGKTWVVEADTVLQLFYGLAEDLTRMTTLDDFEPRLRLEKHFSIEENNHLVFSRGRLALHEDGADLKHLQGATVALLERLDARARVCASPSYEIGSQKSCPAWSNPSK